MKLRLCTLVVLLPLVLLAACGAGETPQPGRTFGAHPGMLSSAEDFARMKSEVSQNASPWIGDWQLLQKNSHDSSAWKPRPISVVVRGASPANPHENYSQLYNDIAAAYALSLDWKISGDTRKADAAVAILNAWSSTLTQITGTSDKYLASGIYGYEIANAAENLRSYSGWSQKDFQQFRGMMLNIFYPMNHAFLTDHNGAKIDHYWANWDLCNIASMMAIGILTDDKAIYSEAEEYYLHGKGNGALPQLVWKLYGDDLGQWQESGRDQGHVMLGVGLAGTICQMAWNQGDDLYGADDNRLLKGINYAAKYNLWMDVPYTTYTNSDVTQTVISPAARGDLRPIWEMLYNHYVVEMKISAPYVEAFAAKVRPEGGGGDYGPNSGGYDQLGYGTLLYSLPNH